MVKLGNLDLFFGLLAYWISVIKALNLPGTIIILAWLGFGNILTEIFVSEPWIFFLSLWLCILLVLYIIVLYLF